LISAAFRRIAQFCSEKLTDRRSDREKVSRSLSLSFARVGRVRNQSHDYAEFYSRYGATMPSYDQSWIPDDVVKMK
jgi:hypothetical protein